MNKVISIFNRYYPVSLLILLGVIVLAAIGQVVNLYFWADDWDLFLKITHPELGLWGMDPGWFGSGPYRYLHTPFMPLYPLFGFNAGPYFAVGILIYFLATLSVFLLVLEISGKRALAIGAAVIYGSLGYMGSYTIFHLSNFYQIIGTVFFTNLTLWILTKYYKSGRPILYLASLVLFYITLEIVNIRAHGLIFLVLGLAVLFAKWKKTPGNIFYNFLKLVPFILIYRNLYSATLGSGGSTTLGAFLESMQKDKVFAYSINPFASFSNVIIPDNLTKFIYSLFGNSSGNIVPEIILLSFFILIVVFIFLKRDKFIKFLTPLLVVVEISYFIFNRWAIKQPLLSGLDVSAGFVSMLGMTMLLLFLLIAFRLVIKDDVGKITLFGIILIFGHYIGYFVGATPFSYLLTTDRYLSLSVVGVAVLLSSLFYTAKFKKISLFPILVISYSVYLIILMNITVYAAVQEVSKPTKRIYDDIRRITPSISKNAILLLDIENGSNLRYLVGSSFPSTAFALFYGFTNRVPAVRSFDEYLYDVKMGKMNLDDLQSFYIGQWKIVDTTKEITSLLKNPTREKALDFSRWDSNTPFSNKDLFNTATFVVGRDADSIGVNPQINAAIDYTSAVPSLLTLIMTASPVSLENKKFPYSDASSSMSDEIMKDYLADLVVENNMSKSCKDVSFLIAVDKDRKEFVVNSDINVSSQTKYSEKEFLHDGLFGTNWSGHVLDWAREKKVEIDIDLKVIKPVTALIWVNYLRRTTPTRYSIFSSTDGENWEKLKDVNKGVARIDGEFVVEDLPETRARYMKMIITDILIRNAPAISEIWTSSLSGAGKLSSFPSQLIDNPMLCSLRSNNEYLNLLSSLGSEIKYKFWWLTDSWENFSEINSKDYELIVDGQPHSYRIFIPAQGTSLEKIRINNFQIPINLTIQKASIRSLTFKEIDEMGYLMMPTGSGN